MAFVLAKRKSESAEEDGINEIKDHFASLNFTKLHREDTQVHEENGN